MRHFVFAAISSAFVGLTTCPALAQNQLTLSPAQAISTAEQAIEAGNLQLAEQIARGLLLRNPKDPSANFLLAQVALGVGAYDEAANLFKKAYRNTTNKNLKYNAAILTARSLEGGKRPEAAKLWVRRAFQNATTQEAKQNAVRGYQQLRSISPWQTSLSFGITPSNNVNNGSNADEICSAVFGGICSSGVSDTRAVSGAFLSASYNTRYRLHESQKQKISVGLDLYHRAAWIKPSERALTSKGAADFDLSFVGANFLWQGRVGENVTSSDLLSFGRTFYGGDALTNRYTVRKEYTFAIGETKSLGFGVEYNDERNQIVPSRSLISWKATVPFNFRAKNGDFWNITASSAEITSNDNDTGHVANRVSISVTPAAKIFNLNPTYTVSLSQRDNKKLGFLRVRDSINEKRRDQSASLSVSVPLPQFEIYGFSPVAIVEASSTKSNIELFNNFNVSTRLEFRSSF